MRKRRDLLARLAQKLDIPREALPGGFGMTLSGRGELTAVGCCRILQYTPSVIRLAVGRETLAIHGKELACSVFGAGAVTVVGEIDTLCFEEGEK